MGKIHLLYIILIPIVLYTLYKRGVEIVTCIRDKNYSRLKVSLLFLGINILSAIGLIWLIENDFWHAI